MVDDTLPPYVASSDFKRVTIQGTNPVLADRLQKLGFGQTADGAGFELRCSEPMTFEELAALATKLRDMGLAFSAGPDWSPSEVMNDLRDRELCNGPYTQISWTGPEQWSLQTC